MGEFFSIQAQNLTSFQQIMLFNNTITSNMFGVGLLVIIFSISFISMLQWGGKQSFVASIWITTVISIFLWIYQLVSPDIMLVLTVITALATVFLFRTKEN